MALFNGSLLSSILTAIGIGWIIFGGLISIMLLWQKPSVFSDYNIIQKLSMMLLITIAAPFVLIIIVIEDCKFERDGK